MMRQIFRYCQPYKRQLGWALTVLGAVLMLVFIPFQVWLILAGIVFVALGLLFSKR